MQPNLKLKIGQSVVIPAGINRKNSVYKDYTPYNAYWKESAGKTFKLESYEDRGGWAYSFYDNIFILWADDLDPLLEIPELKEEDLW